MSKKPGICHRTQFPLKPLLSAGTPNLGNPSRPPGSTPAKDVLKTMFTYPKNNDGMADLASAPSYCSDEEDPIAGPDPPLYPSLTGEGRNDAMVIHLLNKLTAEVASLKTMVVELKDEVHEIRTHIEYQHQNSTRVTGAMQSVGGRSAHCSPSELMKI